MDVIIDAMIRPLARAVGAIALSASLLLGLSACAGDKQHSAPAQHSDSEHNQADVAFATDMLRHHAQALSMVDLTVGRKLSPEVVELAEQIREAQAPEIEQFADWLAQWGEEIPPTSRDHEHAHSDTSGELETADEMPGMQGAEAMQALADASDADFEPMWLEMMIDHHEGAIEMAKTELADGAYRPARKLAQSIVESQSAEIDAMQGLLR